MHISSSSSGSSNNSTITKPSKYGVWMLCGRIIYIYFFNGCPCNPLTLRNNITLSVHNCMCWVSPECLAEDHYNSNKALKMKMWWMMLSRCNCWLECCPSMASRRVTACSSTCPWFQRQWWQWWPVPDSGPSTPWSLVVSLPRSWPPASIMLR